MSKTNGRTTGVYQAEQNRQYGFLDEGFNPIIDSYVPGMCKDLDRSRTQNHRKCITCKEKKPLTEYYLKRTLTRATVYNYHDTTCKVCHKKRTTENTRIKRQKLKLNLDNCRDS